MNTANVHAGRLERRVRLAGKGTMPGIHEFCAFYPFGAISGVLLLRLTALVSIQKRFKFAIRTIKKNFFFVIHNEFPRLTLINCPMNFSIIHKTHSATCIAG